MTLERKDNMSTKPEQQQVEAAHNRAVAYKVEWSKDHKLGYDHKRTKLGELTYDPGIKLDDAEMLVRREFPSCNWARFWDTDNLLICATHI